MRQQPTLSVSPAELIARALCEHEGKLRAFVASRAPANEVDDIMQRAALRAVERAASLRDRGAILPWLYQLHRNVVTDTLRQRASAARVVDPVAKPPESVSSDAAARTQNICGCSLYQAKKMRASYASIVKLVDINGESLADAAAMLDISPENAAVRLHRARKRLRETMMQHCGVESARDCLDCRCLADGCCPV